MQRGKNVGLMFHVNWEGPIVELRFSQMFSENEKLSWMSEWMN